jgi:hypothetical protein
MFNKRKRFLAKEIQNLIDYKIEGFTSTEVTDTFNNVRTYEYTCQEVMEALYEAGFSLDRFEWKLPPESTTKVVDVIILLSMYAFVAFAFYLVIFQIFL